MTQAARHPANPGQPVFSTPLFLMGLMLLGLIIRLWHLVEVPVWIDETYSFWVANTHLYPEQLTTGIHPVRWFDETQLAWQAMDLQRLMLILKQNVHMPLYYLLLNPWLSMAGNTVGGLRGFSVLWSVAMIPVAYLFGRDLAEDATPENRRIVGMWAALLMCLSPNMIYYAQEGRMYTLAMFWVLLATWLLWRALHTKKPARWIAAYTLAALLAMFTHYMVAFILAGQALVILWRGSAHWRLWLTAGAVMALAALLWTPVYLAQQQFVGEADHFANRLVSWTRYPAGLIWPQLLSLAGNAEITRIMLIPVTALLLLLGAWQAILKRSRADITLIALIWLPALLQIGYDILTHQHTSVIFRYNLLWMPLLTVWLGSLLAGVLSGRQSLHLKWPLVTQWLGGGLALLLLALAVLTVQPDTPFWGHGHKKRMDQVAGYLSRHLQPDDLIVANGDLGVPNILTLQLTDTHPDQPMLYWVKTYRGAAVLLPSASQFSRYRRVWFFQYRGNTERGLAAIKQHLQSLYPRVTTGPDPAGILKLYEH